MRNIRLGLFFLTLLALTTKVNSQTITVHEQNDFFNAENVLVNDGLFAKPWSILLNVGEECYIVLKLEGYNKINNFIIVIREVDGYTIEFSYSLDDDYMNGTIIGTLDDSHVPYETVSLPINNHAKYIVIKGTKQEFGPTPEIEIDFVEVTYDVYKTYFGYDAGGNRVSRYTILTSNKSANSEYEAKPENFKHDENTDIRLYPNPTSGLLSFEVINPEMQDNPDIQIKVYSVNGTLIREEEFLTSSFTIDISDEQNGTYMLDMRVNGKKQTFTIIKR